jgi:hypothetical protein
VEKYLVTTNDKPEVTIEADVDLNVKGWNEPEVLVKTSAGKQEDILNTSENSIRVHCFDDCTVYIPLEAKVNVQVVGQDASLKSLKGELAIDQVGRDLTLRDVSTITVGAVGRDITAKRIHGDFKVESVGRGVIVRNVDGQFAAETIGAHLHLQEVSEGVSAQVGGNTEVTLAPVAWQAYSIKAAGDINCRLSEDANALITITSGANQIRVKLPHHSGSYQEHSKSFTLGEGGAPVTLAAGGSVLLQTNESDWRSIAEGDFDIDIDADLENITSNIEQQVSEQIKSQLEAIEQQLDAQLAGLSSVLGNASLSEEERSRINLAENIRAKVNRKIEAARHKVRRKAARFAADMEPPRPFTWPVPPAPPMPPMSPICSPIASDPVSNEERLMILNMLEAGKITAEDAEQLLTALEGASG